MPHLQASPSAKNQSDSKDVKEKQETPKALASETENATNPLLALAATAKEHGSASIENGLPASRKRHREGVPPDGDYGLLGRGHAPVTPSPFGRGLSFRVHPPHAMHQPRPKGFGEGPAGMGVLSPGARRLFPSPIRVVRGNAQKGSSGSDKQNADGTVSPKRSDKAKQSVTPPRSGTPESKGKPDLDNDPAAEGRAHQEPGQRPQEKSYPMRYPPYHHPYHMALHGMPPYPGYPGTSYPYMEHYPVMHEVTSPPRKRTMADAEMRGFSPMKTSVQIVNDRQKDSDRRNDVPSGRVAASEDDDEENVQIADTEKEAASDSESKEENRPKKQRIISPSSSLEVISQASVKGDDDESVGAAKPREGTDPRPTHHPPGYGAPRAARPMGARFPPFFPPSSRYPYPPHYPEGSSPEWHYPHHHPMYPMHHPGVMHPPSGYMYPPHLMNHHPPYPMVPPPNCAPYPPQPYPFPPHLKNAQHPSVAAPAKESPPSEVPSGSLEKKEGTSKETEAAKEETAIGKIKSVAEWQRATIATGMAPSAHRCLPLKGPIPSKYWGEAEKTKDEPIPDFHHLVNYPDYMAKNSSTPNAVAHAQDGKKHCVMCGKERVSSANAMSRSRSTVKSRMNIDENDEDSDNTMHIIPRQNKGLCTACDVRVWIICDTGLEIKWCKGCKNFRPWAAFGDKGLATKCVRCRDRQREKYAMQKDELKQRRRGGTNESKKQSHSEDQTEMAAARGLHNLIAATVEMDEKE